MVDFLYHGEANVYQENLDSFLAMSEELHLKGQTGKNEDKEYEKPQKVHQTHTKQKYANILANNIYTHFDEHVKPTETA